MMITLAWLYAYALLARELRSWWPCDVLGYAWGRK
jgi:hypothetical protein